MTIYEMYGRQAEQLQTAIQNHAGEVAAHLSTLEVLRKVSVGELRPADVEVTGQAWRVKPRLMEVRPAESETPETEAK